MKELLADKDRLKIDVRIVYGKSELAPAEIEWLKALTYVRTSFCKNLHAKCYLSESACIVTSLNLYEFSMVNNNEMGVLIDRLAGRRPVPRRLRGGATHHPHQRRGPDHPGTRGAQARGFCDRGGAQACRTEAADC